MRTFTLRGGSVRAGILERVFPALRELELTDVDKGPSTQLAGQNLAHMCTNLAHLRYLRVDTRTLSYLSHLRSEVGLLWIHDPLREEHFNGVGGLNILSHIVPDILRIYASLSPAVMIKFVSSSSSMRVLQLRVDTSINGLGAEAEALITILNYLVRTRR